MKKLIFFIGLITISVIGFSQVETNQQIEKTIVEVINSIRINPKSFINKLHEYNKDSVYSLNCDKSVKYLIKKLNTKKQLSVLLEYDNMSNESTTQLNLKHVSEFKIDNENDALKSVISLLILNDDFIKRLLNHKYKFISIVVSDEYIILDFGY